MKEFMKLMGIGFATGVAIGAGASVWDNYLEKKVDNLIDIIKERRENKNKEEQKTRDYYI